MSPGSLRPRPGGAASGPSARCKACPAKAGDRLPKDLALAGITTIEAANTYLRDVYIPQHNARFAAPAEQPGSAFVPLSGFDLAEVLCHQKERKAGNDNTVVFRRNRLQIPPSPLRAHYVRATVKVRRYGDGSHAIFHGPRCIGRYDDRGIPADRAAQNVA